MSDVAVGVVATDARVHPRVLVVGPLPPPWHGGSVATEYVLRAGIPSDWHAIHLDTSDRRGLRNIGRFDAGNVFAALAHGVRFIGLLLAHRPAVVYVPIAQNTLGLLRDFLFIAPALLMRRRVVLHVHGGGLGRWYASAPRLMRVAARSILGRADRVIVLGDVLRSTLEGIVPPARVRVLPNGLPDPFPEATTRGAGDTLRVLYLGNLIRSKGFLDVIAAVQQLIDAGVRVHLDLAGGFEDAEAESAAHAALTRLEQHVTMHGIVGPAEKRELLTAADVLAFPTYYEYEGHPYVVLEAMAASLPIVTTAHAALPETIVDGETGLIVPARDPSALAAALRRLHEDAALRARMGAAARSRFLESYTLHSWSAGLVRVLEEAAA